MVEDPQRRRRWESVAVVRDWLARAGFTVRERPSLEASQREQNLAVQLVEEEVAELRAAVEKGDIVEIADALGDIIWVTLEAALLFGIPIEAVFEEISRSNDTKLEGDRTYDASGKLVGGSRYMRPELAPILAGHRASAERTNSGRRRPLSPGRRSE